jgi:hypothetical protein
MGAISQLPQAQISESFFASFFSKKEVLRLPES